MELRQNIYSASHLYLDNWLLHCEVVCDIPEHPEHYMGIVSTIKNYNLEI